MSFIERFSQTVKGDLIAVGNTLGLSKKENLNEAGILGSIGAFTSVDLNNQVSTFPMGTTLDYLKNSSSAILNLPNHSEVLYAELIWSGAYKNNKEDISKNLTKAITFETPKGKFDIGADYRTKQERIVNLDNLSLGVYIRTANVTEYVKKAMSGIYTVGKIPAIINPIDNDTHRTNFVGWTLIVAYKNDLLPPKVLNIKVGIEPIYNNELGYKLNFPGFDLSKNSIKNSKLIISSGEGDAGIKGDNVWFGYDNEFSKLSGPNNFEDNFFASQINNENGILEKSGTFGSLNHDAKNATHVVAGRQGWDITSIKLDNLINKSYKNSVVKFSSIGDFYLPNMAAISINTAGANLRVVKSADKKIAIWGDIVTYSIEIKNVGDLVAEDVVLYDSVPKYLEFLEHSIDIDGVSYTGTFPIVLTNLQPNEKHIVTYKTRVGQKQNKIIKNTAKVTYYYLSSSSSRIKETSNSNVVCLNPEGSSEKLSIIKSVDKKFAKRGDILEYNNFLKNDSDLNLTNIYFTDILPENVIFLNDSVIIDGIQKLGLNPEIGFKINDLKVGASVNIKFKVKVI